MVLWAWASSMPVKRHQELTPWRHEEWAPVFVEGCEADPLNCHCEERSDAAIQDFAFVPCYSAPLPKIATPFGLAMTGRGMGSR